MSGHQGFDYEVNAFKALQPFGISAGTGAAGASSDRPDLEIKLSKDKETKKQGCELKISPTAAGSLVMKYYNGKWDYGDYKGDPEKELLRALGQKYKLLTIMNTKNGGGMKWGGKVPHLQNDAAGKKIVVGAKDKKAAYDRDLKQYGGQNEVHITIPAKAICEYYNTKHCSYINVGTHGFYILNKQDPLGLNKNLNPKIPDFANSAAARIRIRCQYKGGGDYQFVMTMEFSKVTKSPFNLAPVSSSSNVTINKGMWKTAENQMLFEAFKR